MKKIIYLGVLVVCALCISGCMTSGLSIRENNNSNYSHYLYGLYDGLEKTSSTRASRPVLPVKIAVAQIGECAPPSAMIDTLRKEPALFCKIEPIPAVTSRTSNYSAAPGQDESKEKAIQKMCRLSEDLGLDYLFIYGGTIDIGHVTSPLSVLDWTIIGAYVVPSHSLDGTGKAAAALIDVKNRALVFTLNSEVKLTSSATSAGVEGSHDIIFNRLQKEVTADLAKRLAERLKLYL